MAVSTAPTSEYAPPDAEALRYVGRGLTEEDQRRLEATHSALVLRFAARVDGDWTPLRTSQQLVLRLARQLQGHVWDAETREVFTSEAFDARRVALWTEPRPAANDHITIHQYRGDHAPLFRSITLGMSKLGLPDLVVEDSADGTPAGALIQLAAQRLLEGARPDEKGRLLLDVDALEHPRERGKQRTEFLEHARHRTLVSAVHAQPEAGDPDNTLLELWFGDRSESAGAQNRAHDEIWGSHDEVLKVRHDSELEQASARARRHVLKTLKPRFAAGKQQTEQLFVKVPFPIPGGEGNEWMWMIVLRWDGSTVKGVLANDPARIPALRSGMRVEADENQIFDYLLRRADGRTEGNETEKLLERAAQ